MRFGRQFRVLVVASDYEQSVAYYRDTLGLSLSHDWDRPGGRGSVFHAGAGMIEVLSEESPGSPGPPTTTAVVIEVDDTRASYEEIIARGGAASEPVVAPWGHKFFRSEGPDRLWLIFFEEIGGH